MGEVRNIVRDIRNGAVEDVPAFVLWLVGKAFWPLFVVIVAGFLLIVGR